MRLFKKNKLLYIIAMGFSIIVTGVFVFNSKSVKYNISSMINSFYMNIVETDEYKDAFEETSYKNYKILHKKDLEPALPMIFSYLDELEERSKNILDYTTTEELTIQFDYDESVFKERSNSVGGISDVAGYYNIATKTMYMNIEDVYRDVIINMPKVEFVSTGMNISSNNFKETLYHEYSHHIYNSFIKDNNIDDENLPTWFEEGMSEYMANSSSFEDKELNFIPLNKLNSDSEWVESVNKSGNNSPYIQSYYTVYKMIKLYNENILKELIINCKDKTFDESFKVVTNSSLDKFEKILKDDFKNYTNIYDETNNLVDSSEQNRIKIKCLENYIKINKDDIRAYETLCNYYESSFNKVVTFLKESIEKHPKESILWRRLALIYEDNNMIDLARECFNKEEELLKK